MRVLTPALLANALKRKQQGRPMGAAGTDLEHKGWQDSQSVSQAAISEKLTRESELRGTYF